MKKSDELPIFRDSYTLLQGLMHIQKEIPRIFRYSIGEKMINLSLNIIDQIYKANSSYDKLPYIEKIIACNNMLKMLLRLCHDESYLSLQQYTQVVEQVVRVGRQASGWKKYATDEEKRKSARTGAVQQ